MMTKQEHIAHWVRMANRDWETIQVLVLGGQYMFSLFVSHLFIEKLLKAHWVKDNATDIPPFTHNLETLYQQTGLDWEAEKIEQLILINSWNIEGRYQDYKDTFYKIATKEYTEEKLKLIAELRECLLKDLSIKQ